MTYNAVNHQGAVEIIWLLFWVFLMSSNQIQIVFVQPESLFIYYVTSL